MSEAHSLRAVRPLVVSRYSRRGSTTLGNPFREHQALGLELAQRPVGHPDIDTFRRDAGFIQAPDERIAVGLALGHEKQEERLQPAPTAPARAHPAMQVVVVVMVTFGIHMPIAYIEFAGSQGSKVMNSRECPIRR